MRKKKKYYRTVSPPKEGVLSIKYGKQRKEYSPDLVYSGGAGCLQSDVKNLHYFLNKPLWGHPMRYNISDPTSNFKLPNSLVQELENMGYDLTTLKFSIKLKE